ncbi:hypothetical protein [Glutamicibacter sp. JC586]|nr:hypothetical protein [Glutamicibacter sp. JC586]
MTHPAETFYGVRSRHKVTSHDSPPLVLGHLPAGIHRVLSQ